jgi:hypothetical protein
MSDASIAATALHPDAELISACEALKIADEDLDNELSYRSAQWRSKRDKSILILEEIEARQATTWDGLKAKASVLDTLDYGRDELLRSLAEDINAANDIQALFPKPADQLAA